MTDGLPVLIAVLALSIELARLDCELVPEVACTLAVVLFSINFSYGFSLILDDF